MIEQTSNGLNSRSEANPYNEDGFLPLITAPMSSVLDENNYTMFQNAKIRLCFPRTADMDKVGDYTWKSSFHAISLEDFIRDYVDNKRPVTFTPAYRCIDTANGNIPVLHEAIRKAKEIHGNNLVIMAGNVASVEAFLELAKTGVDYIRVGIGGGCLSADTKILMASGIYKNIIDVQPGDFVINKDGNPVKVINTFYSGKKKVSKVKHNAFYNPLLITNDHQVRVSDLSLYKKSSISSKGYKAFFKEDIWKPVSKSINDNLLSPTKINYQLPINFNINLNQFDSDKSKNTIYNLKPSYELGYIFGTFLGDGNINIREDFYVKRNSINMTGSVHWTFGKNEDSIVLTLIEYIENIFKEESGYKKEENKIRVTLYRKWLAQLFSEFYTKDGMKHLPQKWYCLNTGYLKGLYDGLIDSDGYKELTRDCFENTSQYLIELIYFIKSNLEGYFPNTEQRKKTCGQLKNCNENNLKQSYSLRTLSNYSARQTKKFNLLKVTLFENDFDEIDTYDIEVDCPTHSFIANNCIVHNSGCNTTSNTGVGQENLEKLISSCKNRVFQSVRDLQNRKDPTKATKLITKELFDEAENISKVKIVADGISSYIKQCEVKYGFNDNGYAAINKLLFAGADLVMVGKLFAQCVESAGSKRLNSNQEYDWNDTDYVDDIVFGWTKKHYTQSDLKVKYSGMSTLEEQTKYKTASHTTQGLKQLELKPSEGSIQWIPVRWTLDEWLNGSKDQDAYPYLMGWVNSIKSAMSYTGKTKL